MQNVALGLATPSGYAVSFTAQTGSVSGPNYQGYSMLSSFDPAQCAAQCNQNTNCVGFNIFMERAPSVDPNSAECSDPPSYTYYKCTLWGSPVSQSQATNEGNGFVKRVPKIILIRGPGQWRGNFHVVITGSYGKSTWKLAAATGSHQGLGFNKQTFGSQSGTAGPWTYQLTGNTQISYSQRELDFSLDGTNPLPSASVAATFNLDPNPQYYYALNAVYRFDAGAANCKLYFFDQLQPSSSQTNNFFLWMRGRSANITVTCPSGASSGHVHMEQLDV